MIWVTLLLRASVYIAVAVAITLIGLFIFRRYVPFSELKPQNDVAGVVYAAIAVAYAVILGFVIVTVWTEFEAASSNADREANAVADLHYLAGWFPDETRDDIRTALLDYTQSVVDDEWDAMNARQAPHPSTEAAFNRLRAIYRVAGNDDGVAQSTGYGPSLDRLIVLGGLRRGRLLESTNGLSPIMWIGLLGGAVLTIGFAYDFGVERAKSHAIMLSALAASAALLLFMVSSLNYPFRGVVRVQPDGFEFVLSRYFGM